MAPAMSAKKKWDSQLILDKTKWPQKNEAFTVHTSCSLNCCIFTTDSRLDKFFTIFFCVRNFDDTMLSYILYFIFFQRKKVSAQMYLASLTSVKI